MGNSSIEKRTRHWFDSKLNNPYYFAVIATWIVTNRVLVFGLFNFDSNQTIYDRIEFVHIQFQSVYFLWFIPLGFNGFLASVLHSMVVGFFVMVFIDKVNTKGRSVYEWSHKTYYRALAKWRKEEWVKAEKYHLTLIDIEVLKDEIDDKKKDVRDWIEKHTTINNLYNDITGKYNDVVAEKSELQNALIQKDERIKALEHEMNKFKIDYARYGTEDKFIEVTRTVSEHVEKGLTLVASNLIFGIDPAIQKLKKLVVRYSHEGKVTEFKASEDEEVIFENNSHRIMRTKSSEAKEGWGDNLNRFVSLFKGDWTMQVPVPNGITVKLINVSTDGSFFIDDVHTYNLVVHEFSDKKIKLKKFDLCGNQKYEEQITIHEKELLKSKTDKGESIEYRRKRD